MQACSMLKLATKLISIRETMKSLAWKNLVIYLNKELRTSAFKDKPWTKFTNF